MGLLSARGLRRRAMEVVGRVTDEGVCGECACPGGRWTMRARLSPWREVGCASTDEPLEIVDEGGVDALVEWQRRWSPGRVVRARVRPSAPMTARLVALRP